MKCLVFAILLTFVVLVGEALAGCVTITDFSPDGRMTICTICCVGSSCTRTCF
jgi:hypothetical protein